MTETKCRFCNQSHGLNYYQSIPTGSGRVILHLGYTCPVKNKTTFIKHIHDLPIPTLKSKNRIRQEQMVMLPLGV